LVPELAGGRFYQSDPAKAIRPDNPPAMTTRVPRAIDRFQGGVQGTGIFRWSAANAGCNSLQLATLPTTLIVRQDVGTSGRQERTLFWATYPDAWVRFAKLHPAAFQ
jgi:hypothetical protein